MADPGTLARVEQLLGLAESTLVLFRPEADDSTPGDALMALSRFVSFRSYLVFLGSVLGQPWLGYSTNWYRTAIRGFVRQHGDFVVDASRELHMVTSSPSGYLQRVRRSLTMEHLDPRLDEVENL